MTPGGYCDATACDLKATHEVTWSSSAAGLKLEADLCDPHYEALEALFWKGMRYEEPELFRDGR